MAKPLAKNWQVLKSQASATKAAILDDLENVLKKLRQSRYWSALHTLGMGPWAETFQHGHRWYFYREVLIWTGLAAIYFNPTLRQFVLEFLIRCLES